GLETDSVAARVGGPEAQLGVAEDVDSRFGVEGRAADDRAVELIRPVPDDAGERAAVFGHGIRGSAVWCAVAVQVELQRPGLADIRSAGKAHHGLGPLQLAGAQAHRARLRRAAEDE